MSVDITTTNYQSIRSTTKNTPPKSVNSGYSKSETPQAAQNAANQSLSANKKGGISEQNEARLSSKAQNFLKNLRKNYKDYDFFVGNDTDDLKSLTKGSTKEFSVVFTNEELERMANDEKYAQKKLQELEEAIKACKEINNQYGSRYVSEKGGGISHVGISKLGILVDENGQTTFFAEIEKISAKQKEQLEKIREKKLDEKKEAERKAEKESSKNLQGYEKPETETKRANIQANSMDELIEKILSIDWDSVKPEDEPKIGKKFDFSA